MIKKTLKINGVERILILDKDETLARYSVISFFLQDVRSAAVKVTVEPVMLL